MGILIFKHAHITTGGSTGLALNLAYLLQMPFSYAFFVTNLPFYILSIKKMGWNFTWTTLLAVGIVSMLTGIERYLPEFVISAWMGAILGGGFMGIGLSFLFLGKSSLGGIGVVTVYLQQRFGWNPGKINLFFDAIIVGSGAFTMGLLDMFFSALSVVVISTIINFFKKRLAVIYSPTSEPVSADSVN
jgi:uncharacterized membrane-anchored protein YitT (DUF2179 family)